jgi:hypothetical protein
MKKGRTAVLVVMASWVAFSVISGCSRNDALPEYLIGTWKTSDPKYADRYLKFSEDFVMFGTGEGKEESYYIQEIRTEQDEGGLLYTIHYEDQEKEEWTLTFVYHPDSGGTIKLKNSDDIWEKTTGQGEG